MKNLALRGAIKGGGYGLVISVVYTLIVGLLYAIPITYYSQAARTPVEAVSAITGGVALVFLYAAITVYLPLSALIVGSMAGFLISLLFARQPQPLSKNKAILLGLAGGFLPGLLFMGLIAKNLLLSFASIRAFGLLSVVIMPVLVYFWGVVRFSLSLNHAQVAEEQRVSVHSVS